MVDTVQNPEFIRDQWLAEIKQVFDDELQMQQEVRWVTGNFTDGEVLNIPTVSQLTANNYSEGAAIIVESAASTNFELTIDTYVQAGVQVTDKFKKDSYLYTQLMQALGVEIVRAISRRLESDIANLEADQTASNPNTINGADHRVVSVATGSKGGMVDFQLAAHALNKSNALSAMSTAYIDTDVVFELQQIANLVHQQIYGDNKVLKEGGFNGKMLMAAREGRTYMGLLSGFNTFSTNVLDTVASETITNTGKAAGAGARTGTNAKANLFLGRDTFIGAMRTTPETESFRDHKHKVDVEHATSRWGIELYRPESLFVCLTNA